MNSPQTQEARSPDDMTDLRQRILELETAEAHHQQVEEALRKSEALYHDLVETSQDLIWQCDADGRYLYLNPAWEQVFGYRLDEMLGRPFTDFQSPDYAERDTREFRHLLQGGTVKGYETVHRAKDGRELHLVFNAKYMRDAQGNITGTRGTAYDLTQRKRAQQQVADALLFNQAIVDATPIGILTYKASGECVQVNQAATEIAGGSAESLLAQNFRRLASWQQLGMLAAADEALRLGKMVKIETQGATSFGKPIWNEVYFRPFLLGNEQHLLLLLNDILERKRAETALRESEEKFRSITEQMTDMVYITDTHGVILYVSPASVCLFGFQPEEMQNHPFTDFLAEQEIPKALAIFSRAMSTGVSSKLFELAMKRKDGSIFSGELHGTLFRKDGLAGTIGLISDITERKRNEADRLLLSNLESLGHLAGGIAHDFNNLLASILLNLNMIQTQNPLSEEATLCLEEAIKSTLTARGLTRQLIAFAPGGASVRKPMVVSGLLQAQTRMALSGSRSRCEFSIEEGLWPVEADEGQIGQAIQNIVLNAKEAMPQGGLVSVRAENVVLSIPPKPSLPPGEYVRIDISDQGCGIPQEVFPRIFDPYFSTKQRGDKKGMGLGLTIAFAVIQKHNGVIQVDSQAGMGTTFHIYLPACRMPVRAMPVSPAEESPRRHGKILLMEDDDCLRGVLGKVLQFLGHEVALVREGAMAIEAYSQAREQDRPFDVVFLDLTVSGGMGGEETVQALLRINPDVKAVVMSGYSLDPVLQEPERLGFKGALAKPFDFAKLKDTLGRVMAS